MPISVRCSTCGQGHKAPDLAAGRTLKCRACGEPMTVPSTSIDPADILLGVDDSSPLPPGQGYGLSEPETAPETPRPAKKKASRPMANLATLPPLTTDDPPLWRRHLHWLLVLAMIPLGASLLAGGDEADLLSRIGDTLRFASPEVKARFVSAIETDASLDNLIGILPDQRVQGAWLPRTTYAHWGMALVATILFLVFFMFLASDGSAEPMHVLAVGLFTAVFGVGFLLLLQTIASFTEGRIMVGGSVLTLVFYILKFIAFSYSAASDPENGFVLSFLGYTFGVGLCEELVKTVPLFWHQEEARGKNWRGIFIWGLASGAGFGIAEGILYSSRYYNGIGGPGIYVVRFLSCVALHSIWSGSVAITLYLRRDMFDGIDSWHGWIGPLLFVIGVPMVLHGLYDTCLKRDMNAVALLVAVASFGWLAYLTSRLYGTDDADATAAMLAEYKRRKGAMG
jgi:RsiW-degrading membrane proteinase PrsW (M82 family)